MSARTLPADISEMRRQLIGTYSTHEYSFEPAAHGKPSLVTASDHSGILQPTLGKH